MAELGKAHGAKPSELTQTPRSHRGKKRTVSHKLSSDLHVCHVFSTVLLHTFLKKQESQVNPSSYEAEEGASL